MRKCNLEGKGHEEKTAKYKDNNNNTDILTLSQATMLFRNWLSASVVHGDKVLVWSLDSFFCVHCMVMM